MQLDTPFSQLNRKCRRMRSLFFTTLNRLIWNEPCVTATAQIAPASVRPARDVSLILIRNAESKPFDFNLSGLREMKDVFVTIIKKPFGIDWLEMTERFDTSFDPHLALRVRLGGIATGRSVERIGVKVAHVGFLRSRVDGNRLDPVN